MGFADIMVRLVPSIHGSDFSRGKFNGETGLLISAREGSKTASVRIKSEDMNVPFEYLVPVEPEEPGQRVMGIRGQYARQLMKTVYKDDEQWQVEFLHGGGKKDVVSAKELCRMG